MRKRNKYISIFKPTNNLKYKNRNIPVPDLSCFQFNRCSLTFLPIRDPIFCKFGYSYSKEGVEMYNKKYGLKHPFCGDEKFCVDTLINPKFTRDEEGNIIDPMTKNVLSVLNVIVINIKNGNVYDFSTIETFNYKDKMMIDLVTGEDFTEEDIVIIHDKSSPHVLPSEPLVVIENVDKKSDFLTKTSEYVKTLKIRKFNLDEDDSWSMARPTRESYIEAKNFKFSKINEKCVVSLDFTPGKVILELDVETTTIGVINFFGHFLKNRYFNAYVDKINSGKSFEVRPRNHEDISVWNIPITYEKNTTQINKRYIVYLPNNIDKKYPQTNTSKFGISKDPLSISDHYIIGKVREGHDIVDTIVNSIVKSNGSPLKEITIQSTKIITNPFF